jgi:hypothetical protein
MHIHCHPRLIEGRLLDLFRALNENQLLQLYRGSLAAYLDSRDGTASIGDEEDGASVLRASSTASNPMAGGGVQRFIVKVERHPDHPSVPLRIGHLPPGMRIGFLGDLDGQIIHDPDWSPPVDWIRDKARSLHHECAWQMLDACYADAI